MPTRRQQQVADAIHREISLLIQRELKDPRLGFVTVTRAEITADLHYARVFVSVLGTAEEQAASLKALDSAAGWLRRELGGRLTMRFVPALQFRADNSVAHGDLIARLLNEVEAADAEAAALAPPTDDAPEQADADAGEEADTEDAPVDTPMDDGPGQAAAAEGDEADGEAAPLSAPADSRLGQAAAVEE